MLREIGAPALDARALPSPRPHCGSHGLQIDVDAEGSKPGARQRERMAAASHRDVERARMTAALARDALDPVDDEGGR